MTATEDELEQMLSSLQEVCTQHTITESTSSMDMWAKAAPLFVSLKRLNRTLHMDVLHQKERVGEARSMVDSARLALQNLKYEKSMLEQEVRSCQEFQSIYQDIPLHSLEEFEAARSDAEQISDPHLQMLARLQFELEERKRLQHDKQRLQNDKKEVVSENATKKAKLENVERSLKELSASAQTIQSSLENF